MLVESTDESDINVPLVSTEEVDARLAPESAEIIDIAEWLERIDEEALESEENIDMSLESEEVAEFAGGLRSNEKIMASSFSISEDKGNEFEALSFFFSVIDVRWREIR